jgi:hypothetical protein
MVSRWRGAVITLAIVAAAVAFDWIMAVAR